MLQDYFIYNGINSRRYGLRVSIKDTFAGAERDETVVSVPGRNGDLVLDNGRWKNVGLSYGCSIAYDFRHQFESFRSAMMASPGYHRLEDTKHPDAYVMARLASPIEPSVLMALDAGEFDLTFSRKPQVFLKTGDAMHGGKTVTSVKLMNPTAFTSRPLIRVWFTGTGVVMLTLQEIYTVDCAKADAALQEALSTSDYNAAVAAGLFADIDAETGECYGEYMSGGEPTVINLNAAFNLTSTGELPSLAPGVSIWTATGADGMGVTPRWFRV